MRLHLFEDRPLLASVSLAGTGALVFLGAYPGQAIPQRSWPPPMSSASSVRDMAPVRVKPLSYCLSC
jgi:hypothetical protein